MEIKKGTQIKVLCGKDKGKSGEVIEILKQRNLAKVKGINLVKKHQKTTKEKKGGILTKENYIHISNLKNLDEKGKDKIKSERSGKKWHQEWKNITIKI